MGGPKLGKIGKGATTRQCPSKLSVIGQGRLKPLLETTCGLTSLGGGEGPARGEVAKGPARDKLVHKERRPEEVIRRTDGAHSRRLLRRVYFTPERDVGLSTEGWGVLQRLARRPWPVERASLQLGELLGG